MRNVRRISKERNPEICDEPRSHITRRLRTFYVGIVKCFVCLLADCTRQHPVHAHIPRSVVSSAPFESPRVNVLTELMTRRIRHKWICEIAQQPQHATHPPRELLGPPRRLQQICPTSV